MSPTKQQGWPKRSSVAGPIAEIGCETWAAKLGTPWLTMLDDLKLPASALSEQQLQQLDEGPWAKAGSVEVLSVGEVKVAVEKLDVLLPILCQVLDAPIRPAVRWRQASWTLGGGIGLCTTTLEAQWASAFLRRRRRSSAASGRHHMRA